MSLREHITELAKDSPLPAVAGLTLWGMSLNDWVLVLTLGWAVISIASAAWDFYWKIQERKNGSK